MDFYNCMMGKDCGMSFPSPESEKNSSFSVIRTGRLDDWRDYVFEHPKVPITSGKLFLKELLNLSGMEISVNRLAPGEGIPFRHKHRENEEVYIFVRGRGQFQVDGGVFDVEEGSVVRVAPAGVRAYRNNSTEALCFIVIQAKAGSFSGGSISDGLEAGTDVAWFDDS